MNEEIKTQEEFDAFIKSDETFQEKLTKAKKPFSLDMNLPQHLAEMDAIIKSEFELYINGRQNLLESNNELVQLHQELKKYDSHGVYARLREMEARSFGSAIECIKHLAVPQACLVEYSNAAIRFSSKTMRKDFKANLKDMIEEKFNNQLPQISELIYWMEEAGFKPMDRIKRTVSGYKKADE